MAVTRLRTQLREFTWRSTTRPPDTNPMRCTLGGLDNRFSQMRWEDVKFRSANEVAHVADLNSGNKEGITLFFWILINPQPVLSVAQLVCREQAVGIFDNRTSTRNCLHAEDTKWYTPSFQSHSRYARGRGIRMTSAKGPEYLCWDRSVDITGYPWLRFGARFANSFTVFLIFWYKGRRHHKQGRWWSYICVALPRCCFLTNGVLRYILTCVGGQGKWREDVDDFGGEFIWLIQKLDTVKIISLGIDGRHTYWL